MRSWLFAFYNWLGSEEKSAKAAVRLSELAALIAVLVAAGFWLKDIPQRQQESVYQAWQVIDAAVGTETSKARVIALEVLNNSGESLGDIVLERADMSSINLPGAALTSAELDGANLSYADLSGADLLAADLSDTDLTQANLRGAQLGGANLSGANLNAADLSEARLYDANLSEANLFGANLIDAELDGANLSGADLRGIRGWTKDQLHLAAESLEGATMPNGQKYEDWLRDRESRKEDGEDE